ncbi:hypothetical protein F4823DRAFT_564703 [Ustulina deusta]|nr:hypothetical protein F4823DRAFT_564703 [Ustulina deusta]
MSAEGLKNTASRVLSASAQQSNTTASASIRIAADAGRKAKEWAVANPGKAATMGAGAVLVAAPMALIAPILGAIGFGANGVVAGSIAAGAQSGIGSVVAPSLFATLQSAGAAGYGAAAVSAVVQGTGAVVAASAGVLAMFRKTEDGESDDIATEENGRDQDDDDASSITAKL